MTLGDSICNCDKCGKALIQDDEIFTITYSKETIVTESIFQPTKAKQLITWCDDCMPMSVSSSNAYEIGSSMIRLDKKYH